MKKKVLLTTLVMVMMISAIGWFFVVYAGTRNDSNSSLNIFFNPKMRRFVEILNIVEESYYRDISEDELIEAALQGMLKKLDPHSVYIFKENDLQNFKMTTKGEFGGIGFRVGIRDEKITVISPIENTPASRIGIKAGDIIFQIDTIKTEGMDIDQAVSFMRGKPGTEVVLKIYRFGTEIEYTITREIINIKSIPYYGMLNDSVGYIKVVQFSEHLNKEFNDAME
ncbi:PDZ domain-containing protein, partial [candidate division WOR-3 bacterium]|nr:PDZ domain-containing protein [candidate division WOR-3 bacterium]